MISDGADLARIFANLRVFRASAGLAKNSTQSNLQAIENRAVMERLKSLPR